MVYLPSELREAVSIDSRIVEIAAPVGKGINAKEAPVGAVSQDTAAVSANFARSV